MVAAFERYERNVTFFVSMNAQFEFANRIFDDCVETAKEFGLQISLVPATQDDKLKNPKYFVFSTTGTFVDENSNSTIYEFQYTGPKEDWRYIGLRKHKSGYTEHFAPCHLEANDATAAGKKMRELRELKLLARDKYLPSKIVAYCDSGELISPEGVETIFIFARIIMTTKIPYLVLGNLQFYTPGNNVSPLPVDFVDDLNCILAREIGLKVKLQRISNNFFLKKSNMLVT